MINELVFSAVGAALVFFAIWLFSPKIRASIERPKYKFLTDVTDADAMQTAFPLRSVNRRYDRTGDRQ